MARRRKYTTLSKRDIKYLSDPNFWKFFIIIFGGALGFITLIIFAILFIGWLHTSLGLSNESTSILVLFAILAGIVLILASITGISIILIVKYKKMRKEREKKFRAIQIANIDTMTGIEFEYYLQKLLASRGFSVHVTKVSGDLGVDLIASSNSDKFAIQAKRYSTKVSRRAISDAVAAMSYYGCNKAVVITNNFFTPDAVKLAQTTGCILIDRNVLADWIIELQNLTTT